MIIIKQIINLEYFNRQCYFFYSFPPPSHNSSVTLFILILFTRFIYYDLLTENKSIYKKHAKFNKFLRLNIEKENLFICID